MASHLGRPPEVALGCDERVHGIHAGLVETSMMLHLASDLVRMDQAIDFRCAWLEREATMSVLSPEGGVGFGWETQDLHPAGALGNARAATAELGEAILRHQAAQLTRLLHEVRCLDVDSWMQPGPGSD
jgi:creatinine amidohydrolase